MSIYSLKQVSKAHFFESSNLLLIIMKNAYDPPTDCGQAIGCPERAQVCHLYGPSSVYRPIRL
jgi:hypothetical protein